VQPAQTERYFPSADSPLPSTHAAFLYRHHSTGLHVKRPQEIPRDINERAPLVISPSS